MHIFVSVSNEENSKTVQLKSFYFLVSSTLSTKSFKQSFKLKHIATLQISSKYCKITNDEN